MPRAASPSPRRAASSPAAAPPAPPARAASSLRKPVPDAAGAVISDLMPIKRS
jgi:uncharacterized protein